MRYLSTRNKDISRLPHEAVIHGLAPDGGLYVPDRLNVHFDVYDFLGKDYQGIAEDVLSAFLDDYPKETIRACVRNAYDEKFDTEEIVPLRKTEDGFLMELFHGPTSAFKDLALTILPHLLTSAYQLENRKDTIAILTATSGDTGKAALSGFADVPHTTVTVFYPTDGVSPVQKKQMQTARGNNVCVYGVEGNFDDCQRMVKKACNDPSILPKNGGVTISSANSINVGRLIPQMVYYWNSYVQLVKTGAIKAGEEVSFVVPTGNFGDILAGYLAKRSGLPVKKLICASNTNNVLTDFLETGTYSVHRDFHMTMSPSMDILISSNLERLLYLESSGDAELTASLMKQLNEEGSYTVPKELLQKIQADFRGYWTSEEECREVIHALYAKEGTLIDPHTAVAYHAMKKYQAEGNSEPCIVLSTASPFKFSRNVLSCISDDVPEDDFACMKKLAAKTGLAVPRGLAELESLPVRFTETIPVEQGMAVIQRRLEEISHD